MSTRSRTRERFLRRFGLIAAVLVALALILLLTGNWVLAIIVAVPAAVAVWFYLQARTVR